MGQMQDIVITDEMINAAFEVLDRYEYPDVSDKGLWNPIISEMIAAALEAQYEIQ